MESNSSPGKIHCSQSTADLVSAAGKSHWLTQRPDKIVAKGKGEMTTYWVNLNKSRTGSMEFSSHQQLTSSSSTDVSSQGFSSQLKSSSSDELLLGDFTDVVEV